jgi:hypothetical protein
MMKKLLILMLVLGMTSAASAALTWSADPITVGVGDTIAVTIDSSDALPYAGGPAWVGADPSAVASIASIVQLAAAGEDAVVDDPTATGWPGWWTINALDTTGTPGDTMAAGPQWTVTISGDSVGTYVISSDSYGSAGADDLLTINVVPEPMTIALLGLGGLFLLRRRK